MRAFQIRRIAAEPGLRAAASDRHSKGVPSITASASELRPIAKVFKLCSTPGDRSSAPETTVSCFVRTNKDLFAPEGVVLRKELSQAPSEPVDHRRWQRSLRSLRVCDIETGIPATPALSVELLQALHQEHSDRARRLSSALEASRKISSQHSEIMPSEGSSCAAEMCQKLAATDELTARSTSHFGLP